MSEVSDVQLQVESLKLTLVNLRSRQCHLVRMAPSQQSALLLICVLAQCVLCSQQLIAVPTPAMIATGSGCTMKATSPLSAKVNCMETCGQWTITSNRSNSGSVLQFRESSVAALQNNM